MFIPGEREAWAEKYLAFRGDNLGTHSDLIRDVDSDQIDNERIQTEIKQLTPSVDIVQGFCGQCRHLLNHWPDRPTTGFDTVMARSFSSMSEIEAAAQLGCKFCALVFSRLICTRLLDLFRRIEWRLASLGYDGTTSLNIENWQGRETADFQLRLRLPGKKAINCVYIGCESVCLRTDAVSSSGMTRNHLLLCRNY